jgi:hypothetical protein
MELKDVPGVPATEVSKEFLQGMINRMGVSYFKYGEVEKAKGKVDEIKCLRQRLQKYEEDGNTEWLMDVANFAMIEFMHQGKIKFRATSAEESPGIALVTGDQIHNEHSPSGHKVVQDFYKGRHE